MGAGAAIGAVIGGFTAEAIGANILRGVMMGFSLGRSYDNYQQAQELESQLASSSTYSFGPIRNTKSQELPIPVAYGRNRVAGNIIFQKISGDNDQYMDIQVGVSEGPIKSISSIKADNVSITANIRLGNRAQTADSINLNGETFPFLAYISASLDAEELELSGTPTITSIIEGREVEVWNNGTSSWVTQYSQNPAYCLLDFLTNSRYGLGIDKQHIDLESFKTVANHCDETVDDGSGNQVPRFKLDYVIDAKQSSLDIIQSILGTFRAFLLYSGGELRLKADMPEAPVQSYTMDNIVEDSFSYNKSSRKEVPNKVLVQYTDPNKNWQKVYAQYTDDRDIEKRGEVVDKTISLLGINRFNQAGRLARFYQKKAKFCSTFCEFKVGIDSLHCEVGDVITVSHDVPGWVDKEFRILEIHEEENDEMRLVCQEYNDAIYSDSGVVEQPKKDSTLPNPFAKPDNVLNLTAVESGELIGDGSYVPVIHVTYDKPVDHYWKYAHIYYKVSSAIEWNYAGRTEELEFDIKPVSPEIYDVKVVSENRHGIKADFGTSPTTTITITGNENPPSDVTWATCTFEDKIVLQWNDIPDQDKSGFEIRTADMNWGQDTTANSELIYRGNALSHIKEPETVSETFYIKAFNRSGVYSANAVSVTVTNSVPPMPTLHINSTLSQLQLAVDDPNIKDLDIIEFQIDTDSNFGSPEIYKGKDFIREVPAIGDTTNYVRARFIDKLGQQGPWGSGSITPNLIDAKDINQSFNINPISDVTPSSGSLEQLWDMDTGLGPAFGSAPTITFEYPMQWFFDMVRFYPSVACNYYVQAWDKDTEAWIDVIGSSTSPVACNANQWNIKRFDNDKMVATNKMRIVFDAALTLYELKFWTVTLSDEILAQVLTLTGNMKVQSENSSTYIDANGITVSGSPAENEAGAQAKADSAESNAKAYANPTKPEDAHLWHFDRSLVSTDGVKPVGTPVATLRPNEGVFGGAVAIEEGTTNLAQNNYATGELAYSGTGYSFWTESYTFAKLGMSNGDKVTFSVDLKIDQARKDAGGEVRFYIYSKNPNGEWIGAVALSSTKTSYDRYSITFTRDDSVLGSDGNPADRLGFAIYHYPGTIDTGTSYAKRMQIESKSFSTSFVDGSRPNGVLDYKTPQIGTGDFTLHFEVAITKEYDDSTDRWQDVFNWWNSDHSGRWWCETAYQDIRVSGCPNAVNNFLPYEWHTVTFVRENGTVTVYGDGTKKGTGTVTQEMSRLEFGHSIKGVLIDELMISDKAHTNEEVLSWHKSNAPFYDAEPTIGAGNVQMYPGGMLINGEDGIEIVGSDGDRSILNDDHLKFYEAGSTIPHWYSKRVAYGVAQDGDYINLGWDKAPKVQTAIKSLMSYNVNYSGKTQTYESFASAISKDGFYAYGHSIIKGIEHVNDITDVTLDYQNPIWISSYTSQSDVTKLSVTFYTGDAPFPVNVYYKEYNDTGWTLYGSYGPTNKILIPNLPAGKYAIKIEIAKGSLIITKWSFWRDQIVDNGEVMWIAIEGGAD